MLFSVEQAFVGREEIRSPLKTPAGEAMLTIADSEIGNKNHEEDLKQTRRDRPIFKKKLGTYDKCEFSNFFFFQRAKIIISVLVTWMIVHCNLAVRVLLTF